MKNKAITPKKIILPVTVLVILSSIILVIYHFVFFRVVDISPTSLASPYVDITFNKSLEPDGVKLAESPQIYDYKVTGNTLRVYFTGEELGPNLPITIVNLKSVNGQTLANYTVHVRVKQNAALTSDQSDYIHESLIQQGEAAKDD